MSIDESPSTLGNQMPAIRIHELGKRYEIYARPHHRLLQTCFRGRRAFYREFWALRGVTFQVERGETVGIIGRNGSGKSTLLQLIAGTLNPTEGSVGVTGRIAALLELGSGFNPEFTGRENIFLNGSILGLTIRETERQFDAIAAFADIGEFIDHPIKMYSTGMVVRLAFAVAVHVQPDVLVVDEALSVGDTAFQSKCLRRVRDLQERGVAILLATHSEPMIIEYCNRVAYLDRGKLVNVGPTRTIVEIYANARVAQAGGTVLAFENGSVRALAEPLASAGPLPLLHSGPLPATEILGVTITDSQGVAKAAFSYDEEFHVVVEARFHEANPHPMFGIQLKATNDIVLWTANTKLLGAIPVPVSAGETRRYTWRLRAQFGTARYVLAIGCGVLVDGEYRTHSRLHYAGHLDVLGDFSHGSGYLRPEVKFGEETPVAAPHAATA
jgi:lipopolysaccharide transport system ATP-binding protein